MNLDKYNQFLRETHAKKVQSGFELNDRLIFIEEILGQLGYSSGNLLVDVAQGLRKQRKRPPDIRLYGNHEKKDKNLMSRCVIETKNYGSLGGDINNIDFLQLKKYVLLNFGKIQYIASTDYVSFFLFRADVLLNERKINIKETESISKSEIAGFKSVLVYKFDFTKFSRDDETKFQILSHRNLFEEYHFPHPEANADRFNIKKPAVRDNFIRSLYFLMENINNDISVKFDNKLQMFKTEYSKIDGRDFRSKVIDLVYDEDYKWVRNFFIWAIEMNYIPNFIENDQLIKKHDFDKVLTQKNPESNNYYYTEYLITAIYSIINKTLFVRILEDSSHKTGYKFIQGEKEGRYLSDGIILDEYKKGNLKYYVTSIFKFDKPDLKTYKFILKHDIYDWILSEIEEYTLLNVLKTFNEIYLKELDQDILGDIYEHYLQEDRDESKGKSYRRLLGQYYTPRPIVRLMWSLVRDILRTEHKTDLYIKGQDMFEILDPFMGSGTFLNEAILQMKSSDSGKEIIKGDVMYFFKDRSNSHRVENNLTGFELNPLSCSIADINVYFRLIKSLSANMLEKVPISDLNLIRTNSFNLEYKNNGFGSAKQLSLFAEEIKGSISEKEKVKTAKTKNYDIIISNPPYGKITPTESMKKKLLPFAYPENNFDSKGHIVQYCPNICQKGSKISDFEKNRGKIEDMYAFGYGVANTLIKDNGIIAFITSNTILTLPSYKWIRKYLIENYTLHYIINFNKVMERSYSMFSPESAIATVIIIMSKRKKKDNDKIKYLDLSNINSIKGKYDYFNDIVWRGEQKDKNDIESFATKPLISLNFVELDQNEYLSNLDYEFVRPNPIVQLIEKDTEFLGTFGDLNCGISTANDKTFIASTRDELEGQMKQFINNIGFNYQFNDSNIREYIFSKDIRKYSVDKIMYIYYDENLFELMKEKCKQESKSYNARFGDENKLSTKNKLIISAHSFYVDTSARFPSLNCIDGKNTYYLIAKDDILYYTCAILNSKLGYYYRKIKNIDNYEIFPIRSISETDPVFRLLVNEVKAIHELKSDNNDLKKGITQYISKYFKEKILPQLEIFSIEEPNKYFDLKIPPGIGANFFVDSPKISIYNDRVIELNDSGLIIECIDKETADFIFEKFIKELYGDIHELNVTINLTPIERITLIEKDIIKEINKIENTINMLVYSIYFKIPTSIVDGLLKNELDIKLNANVHEIETF